MLQKLPKLVHMVLTCIGQFRPQSVFVDSRPCVKIVVENTQLRCLLFYCHSNKQHIISFHIFSGGWIPVKTIQFDGHKSPSLMTWDHQFEIGWWRLAILQNSKRCQEKWPKYLPRPINSKTWSYHVTLWKFLRESVSFTSILLWIINGQVIRHSTHLRWRSDTHWTVYGL